MKTVKRGKHKSKSKIRRRGGSFWSPFNLVRKGRETLTDIYHRKKIGTTRRNRKNFASDVNDFKDHDSRKYTMDKGIRDFSWVTSNIYTKEEKEGKVNEKPFLAAYSARQSDDPQKIQSWIEKRTKEIKAKTANIKPSSRTETTSPNEKSF
jgi:hypothetical protein